jgi:hypothetical protein
MNLGELKPGETLYTTGEGAEREVWEVLWVSSSPMVCFKELKSQREMSGVVGAPMFDNFVKLVPESQKKK